VKNEFLPQSVPFYAATQHFLKLREQHPEYSYKEATLNPTNLRDRATDWEADLIQQFRNDSKTHEIVGERDTPMGRSLYLARPIHAETACLECHSAPAAAPAALIARYGSDNGFGWQAGEVVGAHVVSVPLTSATAAANLVFRSVMAWMAVVVVLTMLVVSIVVYFLVVRPIRRMSGVAEEVSVGNTSVGHFPAGGSRELTALAGSFLECANCRSANGRKLIDARQRPKLAAVARRHRNRVTGKTARVLRGSGCEISRKAGGREGSGSRRACPDAGGRGGRGASAQAVPRGVPEF
jgi:protein-histidine pros-kinase